MHLNSRLNQDVVQMYKCIGIQGSDSYRGLFKLYEINYAKILSVSLGQYFLVVGPLIIGADIFTVKHSQDQ